MAPGKEIDTSVQLGYFLWQNDKIFAVEMIYQRRTQFTDTTLLKFDQTTPNMGSYTFMAIQRGGRTDIRVWNKRSEPRLSFKGLQWYLVDPQLRIKAKFVASHKPITVMNVLGYARKTKSPGFDEFTLKGKVCRLTAEIAGDGFFFNASDQNQGKGPNNLVAMSYLLHGKLDALNHSN